MKEAIISFSLFFLSSITTGWQQMYGFMWAIWGASTSNLQYLGLAGSIVLLVASFLVFGRRKIAYLVALVAVGLIWAHYGPAIWATGSLLFDVVSTAQWRLLPAALLLASTVRVIQKLGPQRRLLSAAD